MTRMACSIWERGFLEHATMTDRQNGWLKSQQGACAGERQPFMPGCHRHQGEERLERPGNGNTAQRLEGITSDQRTVARIEKGNLAGSVSRCSNHFERADAISLMQQKGRLRRANRIPAAQGNLRLFRIQTLVAGQKTRIPLADGYWNSRQRSMQLIERTDMVNVRMRQHNAGNWKPQLPRPPA